MLRFVCALFLLAINLPLQAEVVGEEVTYINDSTTMKGYIAYDDAVQGKRPGILVVHEWWGHNTYVRERARMLAELGYTALALDMYGDGKQASHPEDAGKFSSQVKANMRVAEERFRAAMQLLEDHDTVAENQIGAIGYCFGGGIVLEMARRGLPLDAVASFHGSLGTDNPAEPHRVQAEVLVANGGADPFVKIGQIQAFAAEMKNAGVAYTFVSYPGVKHGFTNPDADEFGRRFELPLAYNADADRDSWAKMEAMFADVFGR